MRTKEDLKRSVTEVVLLFEVKEACSLQASRNRLILLPGRSYNYVHTVAEQDRHLRSASKVGQTSTLQMISREGGSEIDICTVEQKKKKSGPSLEFVRFEEQPEVKVRQHPELPSFHILQVPREQQCYGILGPI